MSAEARPRTNAGPETTVLDDGAQPQEGYAEDGGPSIATLAPTPKAVALVLIPALVLMLAFAVSYVGAFHEPTPHRVPVAVAGPPAVVAQLNRLPGDPLDARQASSRPDALSPDRRP